MWLELCFMIVVTIYIFRDKLWGSRPKKYPPGPMRYPLVGNLPQLGSNPLQAMRHWKHTYGDIVGLRFGDFNVVMLNSYQVIKEAYDKAEFSGRPAIGLLLIVAGKDKRGLIGGEGPHWSEQRRFALRHLRDFGFGKKSMEGAIQENVGDFIEILKSKGEGPISTHRMLSLVVLSSLWNIVAGEKLPIDDPRTQQVLNSLAAVITGTAINGPVFFLPWLAQLAPKLSGWSSFVTAVSGVKSFMGEKVAEHKKTRDPNNARDFMDVYLNEIDATTDSDSSFYQNVGDENMLIGTINLFAAGSETTSSTLNWAFYFFAQNPEKQEKMQTELDTVVGRNRLPSLADREKLVYTEAVMQEVFRKSSIIPFGVFHNVMEPVTLNGYELPKDTTIMANLYEVHNDPKIWGDPENFRPERFLSGDGKTFVKGEGHVIPFLVGKRACLGETLARTTFYLVLTGVLQRFEIKFDPDTPVGQLKSNSLIRAAPSNKMIFRDRYVH